MSLTSRGEIGGSSDQRRGEERVTAQCPIFIKRSLTSSGIVPT
jgi:hypothetical protein